jgi:hypothetical protein
MRKQYSERVEKLYAMYPRKTGVAPVARKIDNLTEDEYREALSAISWQAELYGRRARKSQLGLAAIPHFATWVNQRGWEAEEVDGTGKPDPGQGQAIPFNNGSGHCKTCGSAKDAHEAPEPQKQAMKMFGVVVCESYVEATVQEWAEQVKQKGMATAKEATA